MALESDGGFFAVGYRSAGGSSYLARVRGRIGGRMAGLASIGPASAVRYAFDANARGDAALLTQVSQRARSRATRRHVYLQIRRAGGEFGRPIQIAGGGGPASLAVAINSGRRVLVVWARDRRIGARRVSASGRPDQAQTVASIRPEIVLSAGLADSGRAAIAWAGGFGGESPAPASGPYYVSLATPRSAFRTRELDRLRDTGRGPGLSNVAITATSGDRLTLGWTGQLGSRAVVKVADVTAAGRGRAQVVSPPDADSSILRVVHGAGGEDVVLFVRYEDTGKMVGAERSALDATPRVPGASAFGLPEEIAGFANRLGADLAIDPLTGRAVATWLEYDGATPSVKLSTRPPVR
jgi:hypothetical protein